MVLQKLFSCKSNHIGDILLADFCNVT